MTTRRIKSAYSPIHHPRAGLHVRRAKTGLHFLYWNEQKLCRYIPEQAAIEFHDRQWRGRVTEAIPVTELAEGLIRLTEAVEG